jgi:hypothetical protein
MFIGMLLYSPTLKSGQEYLPFATHDLRRDIFCYVIVNNKFFCSEFMFEI